MGLWKGIPLLQKIEKNGRLPSSEIALSTINVYLVIDIEFVGFMMDFDEMIKAFSEEDLYEYVRCAASFFIEDDETGFWDQKYAQRLFWDCHNGRIVFPFTREDFDAEENLQCSLRLIGMDADKFWEAILFIYAYALNRNSDVYQRATSPHEDILYLIQTLSREGTQLHIMNPVGRNRVIDSPDTLRFIASFLRLQDDYTQSLNLPSYNKGVGRFSEGYIDLGQQWMVYDEYRAFVHLFDHFCTDKNLPKRISGQEGTRDKDTIISRIAFLTKSTLNEKFLEGRDAIRSVKKGCEGKERPKCYWNIGQVYHKAGIMDGHQEEL